MIKKYLPFIKNPVTVISFLMIYATYIYFYQLGSKPLWIDELASIYNSYDLSRLATIIKQETNMWLYFFLLHFWMKLGESAAIVRSFSAVFTIATIPLIYLLGKEILNKKLGFIGAFFLFSRKITLKRNT